MSPAALVAVFGAGLASFFAPCVVPLVPAYLGMMAGELSVRPARTVGAAAWFVVGFASVFVLIGATVGRIGGLVDATGWTARVGGVVIVGFGLTLLLGRSADRRFVPSRWPAGAILRPLVMGVTFGTAWTPCVGPLLGSALTLAASDGRTLAGAALLAVYAAGLGLPFLLAPLALAAAPDLAARLGRSVSRVAPIAAVLVIGLGVLMVTGSYGRVLGPFARLAAGDA